MRAFISGINQLISFLLFFLLVNYSHAQQHKNIFDQGRYKNSFKENQPLQSIRVLDQLNRYDVKFYRLDLNVSNMSAYINGSTSIVSTAVQPIDTLYLELIDSVKVAQYIKVDSVLVNGKICSFIHENSVLRILVMTLQTGDEITSRIFYHGNTYPALRSISYSGSAYLTSLSEPLSAKEWFPCKQVLDDKADSCEVIITTEAANLVGSNGLLVSKTNLPGGKIRYKWKSGYPIAYYLISIAVGPYVEYNTYAKISGDSVLIQNYLINDEVLLGNHYATIKKIMQCMQLFSQLIGPYPFRKEKYGHCVDAWPLGAMENQTMTTIGYEAFDTTAAYYYIYYYWYSAHELAHSWFGDYVTCATWNDYWLNEGFASYFGEYVALQYVESQASADKWIKDAINVAADSSRGTLYGNIDDSFNLTYKKSALVLHMLRFELDNDSIFFNIIKTYIDRHGSKTATTLDFKSVVEETTGKDFTGFFNQWVFGEGYPIFKIGYYQDNDTLFITSNQTSSIYTASLFKMPFELRLKYNDSDTTIRLYQGQAIEKFNIALKKRVTSVIFDPGYHILAESKVELTGIEEKPVSEINFLRLEQNFPNPFNPLTIIKYSVPQSSFVTLKVFDVLGKEIEVLVNRFESAGEYTVKFEAGNLANGVYIYRLRSGSYAVSKKMVIMK